MPIRYSAPSCLPSWSAVASAAPAGTGRPATGRARTASPTVVGGRWGQRLPPRAPPTSASTRSVISTPSLADFVWSSMVAGIVVVRGRPPRRLLVAAEDAPGQGARVLALVVELHARH